MAVIARVSEGSSNQVMMYGGRHTIVHPDQYPCDRVSHCPGWDTDYDTIDTSREYVDMYPAKQNLHKYNSGLSSIHGTSFQSNYSTCDDNPLTSTMIHSQYDIYSLEHDETMQDGESCCRDYRRESVNKTSGHNNICYRDTPSPYRQYRPAPPCSLVNSPGSAFSSLEDLHNSSNYNSTVHIALSPRSETFGTRPPCLGAYPSDGQLSTPRCSIPSNRRQYSHSENRTINLNRHRHRDIDDISLASDATSFMEKPIYQRGLVSSKSPKSPSHKVLLHKFRKFTKQLNQLGKSPKSSPLTTLAVL